MKERYNQRPAEEHLALYKSKSFNGVHLLLNFYINQALNKRGMYTSSNEVSSQNQLAMDGVTHKLTYMFKPLNFVNVGQSPLFHTPTFMYLKHLMVCSR